jgi:hypothetical protein
VPVTDVERKLRTSIQLDAYKSGYYGRSYSLAPDFESHIKRLRLENPGVRIIAFTTPDSAELFRLLVKQGLYNDYLKWLGVLSENFDEVYDFMGVNSVTTNSKNYIDSQHFSPIVGSYIAAVIEKKNVPGMPLDFGVQVRRQKLQ